MVAIKVIFYITPLSVVAVDTENNFTLSYTENDGSVNAELIIGENSNVSSFVAVLKYDNEKYSITNSTPVDNSVIINDMPDYVRSLTPTGKLWVSGFYSEDVPAVKDVAENLGLKLTRQQAQNDWAVLCFERTSNDMK